VQKIVVAITATRIIKAKIQRKIELKGKIFHEFQKKNKQCDKSALCNFGDVHIKYNRSDIIFTFQPAVQSKRQSEYVV